MSYFRIMSQCDVTFGPIINVGHNDLLFIGQCFMDDSHTLR